MEHVRRLDNSMDTPMVIQTITDGIPGALTCINELFHKDPNIPNLITLDKFGIYGEELSALWSTCCHEDVDEFIKTLQLFEKDALSFDEIHSKISKGSSFI